MQVITQPEAEFYRLLASLQHKEFLYEQPAFPEVEYIFKHALTRRSPTARYCRTAQTFHEQTARAIGSLVPPPWATTTGSGVSL